MNVRTLAALACLAAAPAFADEAKTMTDAERTAFRAEVRSYLLENPEVLMEAITILQDRSDAAAADGDKAIIAANADAIFKDESSWVGGNPDGDVTVVEFMDYRCGYCRKAYDEVAQLIKADGNIRFIVKEFPILGEASDLSSRFAVAVLQLAGPDAYEAAHDALIQLRGEPTTDTLQRLAGDLGLDSAAIMARMDAPEVKAVIGANHALAGKLQINGTPTFVIGDTMVRGYLPLEGMAAMVAEARDG